MRAINWLFNEIEIDGAFINKNGLFGVVGNKVIPIVRIIWKI